MSDPDPIFYSLLAEHLVEGMSTADGQDFVDVSVDDRNVYTHVYTPRSDDPDQDASNRSETEARVYRIDERVDLAVFPDTTIDGTEYPTAELGS